jgi:hypothetical protein
MKLKKLLFLPLLLVAIPSCIGYPTPQEENRIDMFFRWERQAHVVHVLEAKTDYDCTYCVNTGLNLLQYHLDNETEEQRQLEVPTFRGTK